MLNFQRIPSGDSENGNRCVFLFFPAANLHLQRNFPDVSYVRSLSHRFRLDQSAPWHWNQKINDYQSKDPHDLCLMIFPFPYAPCRVYLPTFTLESSPSHVGKQKLDISLHGGSGRTSYSPANLPFLDGPTGPSGPHPKYPGNGHPLRQLWWGAAPWWSWKSWGWLEKSHGLLFFK